MVNGFFVRSIFIYQYIHHTEPELVSLESLFSIEIQFFLKKKKNFLNFIFSKQLRGFEFL